MRNYVIINGVNSLTIQGLAIKTLPPITKPIQRNLREEIDGRDGDIVTTLGYGAYDKTIEIGLFGTFDIDEVIAYFNQKGTITFSNEADKVYYFEALDQVDYAELLKFRTASINFHCQPFKYPLNETPLEEEYEYVEGEGTELTLNDTANAIFNKFDLKGNTSQTSTPTPSSPIPVNVVSGDNEIVVTGRNLISSISKNGNNILFNGATSNTDYKFKAGTYTFNYKDETIRSTYINYSDGTQLYLGSNKPLTFTSQMDFNIRIYGSDITLDEISEVQLEYGSVKHEYEPYIGKSYPIYLGVENLFDGVFRQGTHVNTSTANCLCSSNEIKSVSGKQYTFYTNLPNTFKYKIMNCTANGTSTTVIDDTSYSTSGSVSVNCTADGYLKILVKKNDDSNLTPSTIAGYTFQVGIGTNHVSSIPTELCNIPNTTYQDIIFQAINGDEYYDSLTQAQKDELIYGSWYLHKEIDKYLIKPTSGSLEASGIRLIGTGAQTPINAYPQLYCEYFSGAGNYTEAVGANYPNRLGLNSTGQILCNASGYTTTQEYLNLFTNNDIYVYYPLATPTNTLIEDTTLIEQLEELRLANSYATQTNINQENNDLPFILSVSTLKDGSDHLVINNIGNIYAKPTLDLEGNGIVDIYLNDTQMFEVDLSETNEIVINTQDMEAYNPTTNALANRQVTGDYSKFKLDSGENDLRFSGALTKATITRYERWL